MHVCHGDVQADYLWNVSAKVYHAILFVNSRWLYVKCFYQAGFLHAK